MSRQIVLDTETTGLEPKQGHRVIEIGCVEMLERRLTGDNFHVYLNPGREIDAGAIEVHGITNEFLEDKPFFEAVADDLMAYLRGAELIIHNAPFDVGFLNHELNLAGRDETLEQACKITDTLVMARRLHPGQRNTLDALCQRYDVDNSRRAKHGALLDAEILADVYLMMTGGQTSLLLEGDEASDNCDVARVAEPRRLPADRPPLPVHALGEEERLAHEQLLDRLDEAGAGALWRRG